MTNKDLPFSQAEFDRRIAKTRSAMERADLDAILERQSDIFSPFSDISYRRAPLCGTSNAGG
ncbi:MAG: hypothetical protein AAFO72_04650 [Pseudomonadota bacterium]